MVNPSVRADPLNSTAWRCAGSAASSMSMIAAASPAFGARSVREIELIRYQRRLSATFSLCSVMNHWQQVFERRYEFLHFAWKLLSPNGQESCRHGLSSREI